MKRAFEFSHVRQKGVSKPGRFLVLSLAPFPEEAQLVEGTSPSSRVGIITTKKVGCAVVRNMMRRRVREIIRSHAEPLSQGFYIVIIVRKGADKASYADLEKDYLKCQQKIVRSLRAPSADKSTSPQA